MSNKIARAYLKFLSCAAFLMMAFAVTPAQDSPSIKFKISPASIPAGRARVLRITREPSSDLTGFKVDRPAEDTGVVFEEEGQLADRNTSIVLRIRVDDDADEQNIPLTVSKEEDGGVTERHTVDLTITAFKPRAIPSQATPPGVAPDEAVDSMIQPMSYKATKDVFGRRVADAYYAVVVGLGNNTGFDLQINKIAFNTTIAVDVPNVDENGAPVWVNGEEKKHKEFLQIAAIDRSLVRPTVERDQTFGRRALIMNLIGGVGTFTTGFLPFFHALGPRANYSSFTSILNGQFKEGFNLAVPDLTIRQLNRLDDSLVMDQDFILPNNSERNTVVFVPRASLNLSKSERDDLQQVRTKLGNLVIVGRKIERYANRQIVVRTGASGASSSSKRSSETEVRPPEGAATPTSSAPSVNELSPSAGVIVALSDVKIAGGNFSQGASVKFGDKPAFIKSLTPTEITVLPPAPSGAGGVKVVVTNANGQQSATKDFTYFAEFFVGGSDKGSGSTAGGDTVKIIGGGFLPGVKVSFDGTELPANSVTVANTNTIMVKTPAHAPGNGRVTIVNPSPYPDRVAKELAGGFTYNP